MEGVSVINYGPLILAFGTALAAIITAIAAVIKSWRDGGRVAVLRIELEGAEKRQEEITERVHRLEVERAECRQEVAGLRELMANAGLL